MRIWITMLSCILWGTSAVAGTLKQAEVAKLKADITAMYEAFEKGDAELIIASTHESVYSLVGGQEEFKKASRAALQQLQEMNVKFLSSEIGTPTQTYPAGDEEVCFVPRISELELQGKKARLTGFMIAIRRTGGGTWKYLDGSPLRQNPELLKQLFPKLTTEVELPPNKAELL